MFADFVQLLGNSYEPGKVHEGVFAAMMDVQSVNEVSSNLADHQVPHRSKTVDESDIVPVHSHFAGASHTHLHLKGATILKPCCKQLPPAHRLASAPRPSRTGSQHKSGRVEGKHSTTGL